MTTASEYGARPTGLMAPPPPPDSHAALPPPALSPPPPPPSNASTSFAPQRLMQPPPPPEREFASRDELLAFVRDFTVAHGYAVVISKSNVPRGQVWLRCDLGGSQRAASPAGLEGSRKRKSASRRQECPFQLYGRRLQSARWVLRVQDARHNHDVAADAEQLVAHPVARRLSLEQKLVVQELTERGVRPAMIVEHLKDRFPDKPIKVQDIYNARNYIRRERNAGREPFTRPEGWTASGSDDQLGGGQRVASQDGSDVPPIRSSSVPPPDSGDASNQLKEWFPMDERLQGALQRVSRKFPRWGSQRQRYFLSQLEHLLGECSQSEPSNDASEERRLDADSVYDANEYPPLAVEQPVVHVTQEDDEERAPPASIERATDLLIAPSSPHPPPSPPPSPSPFPPPSSGLPSPPTSPAECDDDRAVGGEGGPPKREEPPEQPAISL